MAQPIQWQNKTVQSDPITIGNTTLTLQSQALHITYPFGGFVWHRPTALYIKDGNTFTQHPIEDVTRKAQWTFFALTIILFLIATLTKIR